MAFGNGQQNLLEALLRFQDPNAPGFVAPGGYDVSAQTETPTIDPTAIDPVALGIEARKLQRDQGLAEAMMSQGYTPNSGPLGILAPVLGAVLGSRMQRQGDEKLSDLVGKYGQYRQQADAVKFARQQQEEEAKAKRELEQIAARAREEAKYREPKQPSFEERLFGVIPPELQGKAALGKFGLLPKDAPAPTDIERRIALAQKAGATPEQLKQLILGGGGAAAGPFADITAAQTGGFITPEDARNAVRQKVGVDQKQQPVTAEARTKISLIDNAIANAKEYQRRVVGENGDFKDIESMTGDTPALMQSAVQDMLYAKSGASAPAEEVNKAQNMYMPSKVFGIGANYEFDKTKGAKVANFIRDMERMRAEIAGQPQATEPSSPGDTGGWSIKAK